MGCSWVEPGQALFEGLFWGANGMLGAACVNPHVHTHRAGVSSGFSTDMAQRVSAKGIKRAFVDLLTLRLLDQVWVCSDLW